MNPIEQHITQLLRTDRRAAVSEVYDHYADTLYGVLCSMLKDSDVARDVLQETMIKVWKNGGSFDPTKARLFTWLLRIARNTAIDKMRSEGRQKEAVIQNELTDVDKIQKALNPDHLDVEESLNKLESKYAQVIHALFFIGLTQEEASKALDIPIGTVKSRLRIGLRELKSIYQDPLVLLLLMDVLNQ
ncbi:MAG: RNA polymerase sigma factor [Flavobacteriales bacterium]|nr:RNA polymerase sigma factor [Flavobacteriales bacterium]MDG1780774.1 RNA polymerase sigma factor [Flavobacteriales bacterium]MDG2245487.1 RNA polymerase sigma factor [Flavobacteriales bacterium]